MSKVVKLGNRLLGGGNPVLVQSMANVKTSKIAEVVEQIKELEQIGCDVIRVSVKDDEDVKAIAKIKSQISIPLVADIHFNYKYALGAIDGGVDKIRINPGNIGSENNVAEVAKAIKANGVCVR
ncbi:MAG: flavodoxin-dependent (E)-4-hydroxy-3-methylbut-2-enyl-diphosphate synthase, partial [Clostridia bacterium]|nr:flavodoxin-dependent (E)-4-hydroxy-3-methylbut-2-enyl-diphosphate synthase [Clostridia bacterium]